MPHYQIAQVNISRAAHPLDASTMRDFFAFLVTINELAETTPGFVWRFQFSAGDATGLRVYDDDRIIVNFSVWESLEALKKFVYQGDHAYVMRKRRKWFSEMEQPFMALWWVPAGHIPTWEEAQARLDYLRIHGATPFAFNFQTIFTPDTMTI